MKHLFSALTVALLLSACSQAAPVTEEHVDGSAAVHDDAAEVQTEHDDSMTMDEMVEMLEGKTGDDFDRAFIEGMVPHHQGAVEMAKLALQHAKHEEIKEMARAIIDAQQKEIEQMWQWQNEWGYAG